MRVKHVNYTIIASFHFFEFYFFVFFSLWGIAVSFNRCITPSYILFSFFHVADCCLLVSVGCQESGPIKVPRKDLELKSRQKRWESWSCGMFLVQFEPKSKVKWAFSVYSDDRLQISSSQPDIAPGGWKAMLVISPTEGQVSFSQPTKPEHMLLGSQLLCTPGASQVIHKLTTAGIQGHPKQISFLYRVLNALPLCLSL